MDTTIRWEVAAGTVQGRDHRNAGRNNQDAFCWCRAGDVLVAVVADGCGSGAFSEVGARLGSRILAESLRRRLLETPPTDVTALLEDARRELLATLAPVVAGLGGRSGPTVSEHFLFTLVGALVGPDEAWVFGAGDGVWAVDEKVTVVESVDNTPRYPGYGLVDGVNAGPPLEVWAHAHGAQSVMVGTDGVSDLLRVAERTLPGRDERVGPPCRLWRDDGNFANPYALNRRLALLNREAVRRASGEAHREGGLLPDDTTLVVARRVEEGP